MTCLAKGLYVSSILPIGTTVNTPPEIFRVPGVCPSDFEVYVCRTRNMTSSSHRKMKTPETATLILWTCNAIRRPIFWFWYQVLSWPIFYFGRSSKDTTCRAVRNVLWPAASEAMSLVFSNAACWSTATIRRFKVDAVKPTSKSPIIELPQTGRP